MSDRLKAVWSGTPQWDAWLKHHRCSKSEARMLVCQAHEKPFYVPSEWPPDAPRADQLTRHAADAIVTRFFTFDCRSHQIDGVLDEMATRAAMKAIRVATEAKTTKQRRRDHRRHDAMLEQACEAINIGQEPHVEGDRLGTIVIDDPHDQRRRVKITNLRDDPIGQMHRRGQLLTNEEKQQRLSPAIADVRLEAARRWQVLYERAEIGGARGIDPGKPAVDGGKFVEPDADGGNDARDRLHALRCRLGMIDLTPSQRIHSERLLVWVLGDKKTLGEVADIIGIDRRLVHLGRHLIEKLDIAAIHLGVSMRPNRGPKPVDDKYTALSGRYLRSFQSFSPTES